MFDWRGIKAGFNDLIYWGPTQSYSPPAPQAPSSLPLLPALCDASPLSLSKPWVSPRQSGNVLGKDPSFNRELISEGMKSGCRHHTGYLLQFLTLFLVHLFPTRPITFTSRRSDGRDPHQRSVCTHELQAAGWAGTNAHCSNYTEPRQAARGVKRLRRSLGVCRERVMDQARKFQGYFINISPAL